MTRVLPEAELQTLQECRYRYPAETLQDLRTVRTRFSDLRLYVDFYCFPNSEKKKLVYLAGTLPILYEGSEYNIPVCIWLHETHPVSQPRCFVCPSVSMVINLSCPCVDSSGAVIVDGLRTWTYGQSNLSLLLDEMRRGFQKDTPLYARFLLQALPPPNIQVSADQAPPPAGMQVSQACSKQNYGSSSSCSCAPPNCPLRPTLYQWSPATASQLEQGRVRSSYIEDLLGIDFSTAPTNTNPFLSSSLSGVSLSRKMEALRLDGNPSRDKQNQSEPVQSCFGPQGPWAGPGSGSDLSKVGEQLSPKQVEVFDALMTMKGWSFNPDEVIEAVRLNPDFPSALRFLTHTCPICQDQVSFSKMIPMTHCSCFLCHTCFTSFFSVAIKERIVEQFTCPQCGQPEIRGQGALGESMDYFSLLDTQIRHFLPLKIHELFQRKLRDRALQEMPNFCWCAHCSFGMLHEDSSLRMHCPSCKKSTCSRCRSPWSLQHQGLSCEQVQTWQHQNQQVQLSSPSIECPNCQFVFSLSKGGCLHFTCTLCQHQFCGSCNQSFAAGAACSFFAECRTKGLHAHHPRDCLYHLRDWSVTRLHLLLQYYRASPSCVEPAKRNVADLSQTAACSVLEFREEGSSGLEEPCGLEGPLEYRGYCQGHYKERLVELINQLHADPVVLFSPAEMVAELQRWCVAVPIRMPEESEHLYTHRLRQVLTNSVPLRKKMVAAPVKPAGHLPSEDRSSR